MTKEPCYKQQMAAKLLGSLMTVPETAEMMRKTRQRILQYIAEGRLDAAKKGGEWLILAASVQQLMDALKEQEEIEAELRRQRMQMRQQTRQRRAAA